MPAGNPLGYMSPEVIAQLTGLGSPVSFTESGQNLMAVGLQQQGVFPNDSGPAGELYRRILEVERTRRLHDAAGNSDAAENTRRGSESGGWFMPDLKAALLQGG